jgi:hypothetical protein
VLVTEPELFARIGEIRQSLPGVELGALFENFPIHRKRDPFFGRPITNSTGPPVA